MSSPPKPPIFGALRCAPGSNKAPRALSEVLANAQSPALASLKDRAQRQHHLLHHVRASLGAPMADAVHAASYDEETLTLILQSPAWASHLRLAASTLAPQLSAACGIVVKCLQIRVRPGASPPDGA